MNKFFDFDSFESPPIPITTSSDIDPILREIKNYNIFDFLSRVSALNLIPYNQNKCIVFDYLIDSILVSGIDSYVETNIMSANKFKQTIDSLMHLNIAGGVDPIDMPFIQNIRFYGNKWAFNGVTPSCAYNFQNLIDVLAHKKEGFNDNFLLKCNVIIEFVLAISTEIAEKCGYSLNTLKHYEVSDIRYLDSRGMRKLSDMLIFDGEDFDDFMLENICCNLRPYEELGSSEDNNYDFYYAPFVKTNDGHILLLNPTLLLPFAINKILVWAQESGDFEELINRYNEKLFYESKQSLLRLGHKKLKASNIRLELINNSSYKEVLYSASNDGVLFLRCFCDNSQKYENKKLLVTTLIEAPSPKNRIQQLINSNEIFDKNKVYVINILSGFGRGVYFSYARDELPYNVSFSPFELSCIAINEHSHPNFLIYYLKSRNKLNIMKMPYSLEFNYLTMYAENGYSFYVDDDCDIRTVNLFPGFGDTVDYLNKALKKENRHLADIPESDLYREVVLNDAERQIYCATDKKDISLLNHFSNIKIWIQCALPKSIEEFNIKKSIVDLISYWLSECKDILEQYSFNVGYILLKNAITDDPYKYYIDGGVVDKPLRDLLKIEKEHDNIWVLHWTADAFHKFARNDNQEEKELIKLIFELFSTLTDKSVERRHLDKVFENPLKTKMFVLNISEHPYFKPIFENFRKISIEWEHYILDEIGDYLINEKGYVYGEINFEDNNKICNEIVAFLYSKMQKGLEKLNPTGLFELLFYDLEIIMYSMMIAQRRYAYDLACYPELKQKFDNDYNELNKSSAATKFLLEYVTAIPPQGSIPLGELDYEYYLTICSLIIEWANNSDLFRYKIISNHIEILRSGRIGFKKDQTDELAHHNYIASRKRLNEISNPYVNMYTSKNLSVNYTLLDEVFIEEFGYSFKDLYLCVMALIKIGDEINSDVKRMKISEAYDKVIEITEFSNELVEKIISSFSLSQREDFMTPSPPYDKNDVSPWKFNRRLSFIRRPIAHVDDDLIWGNRQLYHSLLFLHDLILSSKLKVSSKKFNSFLGELINQRGNDFNDVVADKIKEISSFIVDKKVKQLNGKKITNESKQDLGDIDVLVIIPERKRIIVVEVKDFSFAKTPYEMHQEYLSVFCDKGEKMCYVSKHKKRVNWILDHIDDVIEHYNLPKGKWRVKDTLIVDETIISNEYFHKRQNILLYSDIEKKAFLDL